MKFWYSEELTMKTFCMLLYQRGYNSSKLSVDPYPYQEKPKRKVTILFRSVNVSSNSESLKLHRKPHIHLLKEIYAMGLSCACKGIRPV